MKLSTIIVNYNTRELLKDCIENLLKVKEQIPDSEIIVVDNQSFDGSDQMVEYEYKDKVIFIKNPQNSLSGGHNLGFQASSGKYILHLGSDAYPTADALNRLMEYMDEHKDAGITTAKIVTKDGSLDWDAHRGLVTPWTALIHWLHLNKLFPNTKLFDSYYLRYKDLSVPHEIDACISHFMLVSREAYERVGLWDTDYFIYGEDLDFCYRMQKSGYKIMYIPDVQVLHLKGGGVGRKTTDDITNASRRDYNHLKKVRQETVRAMKVFYSKNMASKYPFFINWLVYLGIFLMQKLRSFLYLFKGSGY